MRAVVIGSDGSLAVSDVADPRPGPHDLLLDVAAASVNRADLAQRAGAHDPGLSPQRSGPLIAGMDAAGTVAEIGERVTRFHVGERVMGLLDGGYAERALLDSRFAIPVPDRWTMVEAAAAVSGLQTEHDALVRAAQLRAGEVVLIHGASTPVGLTAIQLARHLGARAVIGTIRGPRRHGVVAGAGADLVICTDRDRIPERVAAATDGHGADVIVDHVGGQALPDLVETLALEGRLVSVGRLGGRTGELDLEALAYKRARIIGVTFRTRSRAQYAAIAQAVAEQLLPAMSRGELRPAIDRTYPLALAASAQARMAANEHHGKLVLTIE